MADIKVPVVKIERVLPHDNADSLEIVEVGGWQVVTGKGNVKEGDLVVHFPPQAVLPFELSEKLGVTKYLSKQRVKAVRLRGEVSHGFVAPFEEVTGDSINVVDIIEGDDLMGRLGIIKYEPPTRIKAGDAEVEVDEFPKYTSIENMRNNRDVFKYGDPVVVTEKIHGTNSRIGMIDGEMFAGSKGVRRKPPQTPDGEPLVGFEGYKHHTYWFPWSLESVQNMIAGLIEEGRKSVILYGEIYGSRIQKLGYGIDRTQLGYVAFDLKVDGEFLNYGEFTAVCDKYGVPRVPEITKMEFDYDMIAAMADGGTLLSGDHIREGVVVKPLTECNDPKIGRKILKFVSSEFLAGEDMDSIDDQE